MVGVIRGTGACLPETIVDNEDLAGIMDTSDEWIRERTGIARRRLIREETTVSMAVRAAERALEDAGVGAEEIDLILVSTVSSNTVLPSTACAVQEQIGADSAVCFDLNAACTGFLFGLSTAQTYIYAGAAKHVLVIGAESLSGLVNWEDRSTAILFGDGAGAVVLCAREGDFPPLVMHSDGGRGRVLTCGSPFEGAGGYPAQSPGSSAAKDREGARAPFIRMDGQEIFRFAVRQVPGCIEELLEKCGRSLEEIDLFLLHQANARIVEGIARRLRADPAKFPMNLAEYGNTSSASIPILLDELNRGGRLREGMRLVLAGFGAGLSWGAAYLEWQKERS